MPVGEEHYESIPWSQLVEQTGGQPWLVYVAALAVVALVAGAVLARGSGTAPPALGVATSSTSVATTAAAAPLSEADLRAPDETDDASLFAMYAEWIVRDYFTVDGSAADPAGQGDHMPVAVRTYVEWARVWDVESLGDGIHRASVAYQSITETATGFRRTEPRAVAIQLSGVGDSMVADLPEPIDLPTPAQLIEMPAGDELPQPVVDQALDMALAWGTPKSVVGGTDLGDGWRVVVTIEDEFGTAWPMMVAVPPPSG